MGDLTRFILWAEDDDNDAFLVQRALQKAEVPDLLIRVCDGEKVVEYLNGQGCYSNRARYPFPTLLVMDIKMPRKTGLEVLEWKQSQPQLETLPVVIFSSSGADADRLEAERLGAHSYWVKPSSGHELEWMMRKLAEIP